MHLHDFEKHQCFIKYGLISRILRRPRKATYLFIQITTFSWTVSTRLPKNGRAVQESLCAYRFTEGMCVFMERRFALTLGVFRAQVR